MICKRTATAQTADFKTRAEGDDLYIDGYFAVFGAQYWLWGDAFETVDEGAFHLERDMDIRALTNHDTTLVLGRTTIGTLKLSVDERGLFGSILINRDDQDAVNLYHRVQRGDVSQCSFGFDILAEEIVEATGQPTEFHLQDVKLYEVSVCTFPAYDETGVAARKKEIQDIEARKAKAWTDRIMKKLTKEDQP